ncbi:MAG: DUF202 domain-containing protein [Erysipelotrichaceae bacterium]|nr:DUF202 domain-containing protein [Erysipelotrichaceae bacterium]
MNIIDGYKQEIAYQKHMLDNLKRWRTLSMIISAIGVTLVYFFKGKNLILSIIGWVFIVVGVIAMLVFGYGIYKGTQNIQLLIDDLDRRRHM